MGVISGRVRFIIFKKDSLGSLDYEVNLVVVNLDSLALCRVKRDMSVLRVLISCRQSAQVVGCRNDKTVAPNINLNYYRKIIPALMIHPLIFVFTREAFLAALADVNFADLLEPKELTGNFNIKPQIHAVFLLFTLAV
jgi:hypothetical protein